MPHQPALSCRHVLAMNFTNQGCDVPLGCLTLCQKHLCLSTQPTSVGSMCSPGHWEVWDVRGAGAGGCPLHLLCGAAAAARPAPTMHLPSILCGATGTV